MRNNNVIKCMVCIIVVGILMVMFTLYLENNHVTSMNTSISVENTGGLITPADFKSQ